jgi:hypothetical protein
MPGLAQRPVAAKSDGRRKHGSEAQAQAEAGEPFPARQPAFRIGLARRACEALRSQIIRTLYLLAERAHHGTMHISALQ